MATYRIAVLPGDGVGQEVTPEAVRILQSLGKGMGVTFEFEQALCGGSAIDATGQPLPPETLKLCQEAHAILFGAVYGYLSLAHSAFLFQSTFLLSLGLLLLGGYAFLGKRYWFSVPFRGILLATVFYVIALIINWA